MSDCNFFSDYPAEDDDYNVLDGNHKNDANEVEDGVEALAKPDMDDLMEKDVRTSVLPLALSLLE